MGKFGLNKILKILGKDFYKNLNNLNTYSFYGYFKIH